MPNCVIFKKYWNILCNFAKQKWEKDRIERARRRDVIYKDREHTKKIKRQLETGKQREKRIRNKLQPYMM